MRSKWRLWKRIERQQGLRKSHFIEKSNPRVYLFFFKKKHIFVPFLKKTKSILNCIHCIVHYYQFQNYTIITCYSLRIMAFKFEGKEYPAFVFAVLLVNGKAWHERAQQTEKSHSHTNSAVSRQVYVHAQLVQHLSTVFFQHMVWYGPTSETVWMQRGKKND